MDEQENLKERLERIEENYNQLQRAPLKTGGLKIPIIGNRKKVEQEHSKTDEIRDLLEQEKIDTLRIEKVLKQIDEKKGGIITNSPIRTPLLLMVRENNEIEWFEGVKAGTLRVPRKDGKTAQIDLPKSKLMTTKWGNKEIPLWIAHENSATALPNQPEADSAIYYQAIEEMISNRKNFEAQKLNAYSNLFWTIGIIVVIGIIAAAVIPPLVVQKTLPELLFPPQEVKVITVPAEPEEPIEATNLMGVDEWVNQQNNNSLRFNKRYKNTLTAY